MSKNEILRTYALQYLHETLQNAEETARVEFLTPNRDINSDTRIHRDIEALRRVISMIRLTDQ